jgi:hypothetical protein
MCASPIADRTPASRTRSPSPATRAASASARAKPFRVAPRAHRLGDLGAHRDQPLDAAVGGDERVVDEAEVAVLRHPVTVAVERYVVLRRHERGAGVEHPLQHGEVRVLELGQHVPDAPAERLAPGGDGLLVARVHQLEHQLVDGPPAHDRDRDGRLPEHVGEARALDVQRRDEALPLHFGQPPRRHVLDDRDLEVRAALRVAHERERQARPDVVPRRVDEALLDRVRLELARGHVAEWHEVAVHVVRVRDRGPGRGQQLRPAVAEHPAERVVHVEPARVGEADRAHADRRVREHGAAVRLARAQLAGERLRLPGALAEPRRGVVQLLGLQLELRGLLLQLLVGRLELGPLRAELRVRVLERAAERLALRVLAAEPLVRRGARHRFGDVLHVVDDVAHRAVGPEHGKVARRPVAHLPAAVGALQVVALHVHAVRRARAEHRLERRAQVRDAARLGVLRVRVGEHLEQRASHDPLAGGERGREPLVARREHGVAGRVGREHQHDPRRGLEERPEVGAVHEGRARVHRPAGRGADVAR